MDFGLKRSRFGLAPRSKGVFTYRFPEDYTYFSLRAVAGTIHDRMTRTLSDAAAEALPTIGVSLGVLAWNEEAAIRPMLESLFRQSFFAALARCHLRCEILCVANGCTDRTPAIAAEIFNAQTRDHPGKDTFSCRVVELPERGKLNAWNVFVHQLSSPEAEVLFLMDGDIVLHHPETLWNMYEALENNSKASIATDQPIKDIALKSKRTLGERLSLSTSRMTQSGAAQLSGQLYCIKATMARNIYLPRDLVACEDGFIKSLVCTYFATRELSPDRIVLAPNASHVFQAYTSPRDILNNQKRQMIGQTMVHLLVDQYLKQLPLEQRLNLAETLRAREAADPLWLKRLIGEHVRRTRFFWRLFPRILTFRFQRLARLRGRERLRHLPAALAGWLVTLVACWRARRFLKRGYTDYWPETHSPELSQLRPASPPRAAPAEPEKPAVQTQGVQS